MASAALAGTLALSSAALGDSDFLSSEDWEDLDSHSSGVLADSDGLSSALGDSGSPSSEALEDLDGLSTGALAVTGRPFLADTAATVDSVTHGTRESVAQSANGKSDDFRGGSSHGSAEELTLSFRGSMKTSCGVFLHGVSE